MDKCDTCDREVATDEKPYYVVMCLVKDHDEGRWTYCSVGCAVISLRRQLI